MEHRAVVARIDEQRQVHVAVEAQAAPAAAEVVVAVEWSALNYKDALALEQGNKVLRRSPIVMGLECAGRVLASEDPRLSVGDAVLLQGHGIGTESDGGFAGTCAVPAAWATPLPEGISTRDAMVLGMAASTAMASIAALEDHGLRPGSGPVAVTGAAGGVGSLSVLLAARLGYEVVASTGRAEEAPYLERLGAVEVVGRDGVGDDNGRVLGAERWAAGIDCVGGRTLAELLRCTRYGGAVAASGLTGGSDFTSSVFPFITRGVSLLGIDVVATPRATRQAWWQRIASLGLEAELLEGLVDREVDLNGVLGAIGELREGRVRGRVLVRPAPTST